jgi:hypothetical protein
VQRWRVSRDLHHAIRLELPVRVIVNRDQVLAAFQSRNAWSQTRMPLSGGNTVADLKLGPLPKQSTVKVTVVLSDRLKEELDAYAAEHGRIHGEPVETAVLIPHMLEDYLRGDRAWRNHRKQRGQGKTGQRRTSSPTE